MVKDSVELGVDFSLESNKSSNIAHNLIACAGAGYEMGVIVNGDEELNYETIVVAIPKEYHKDKHTIHGCPISILKRFVMFQELTPDLLKRFKCVEYSKLNSLDMPYTFEYIINRPTGAMLANNGSQSKDRPQAYLMASPRD